MPTVAFTLHSRHETPHNTDMKFTFEISANLENNVLKLCAVQFARYWNKQALELSVCASLTQLYLMLDIYIYKHIYIYTQYIYIM